VAGYLAASRDRGATVTVPTAVVVEWWRGQRGPAARLLDGLVAEPLTLRLARVAGEALARHGRGAGGTDAVVVASAAQRGDIVLTSDVAGLEPLREAFPGVRVLAV
jgi:hypothetical protein